MSFNLSELRVHYHQYHLNPRHLSSSDNRLYRLSNFLVREHEDGDLAEKTGGSRGLFRCHECFNVFSEPRNLQIHLAKHQEPVVHPVAIVAAAATEPLLPSKAEGKEDMMPPRMEHLPREDFEDAAPPRPRKKVLMKKRRVAAVEEPGLKRLKHKTQTQQKRRRHNFDLVKANLNQNRPRRQATLRRIVKCESEVSDEFNSNSENEGDLTNNRNRFRRPQRECKARTKTLVAISLAEQDYEKFDLDFAKFKTDVTSRMSPEQSEVTKLYAVANVAAIQETAREKANREESSSSSLPGEKLTLEGEPPRADSQTKKAKKLTSSKEKSKAGRYGTVGTVVY